MANKKITKLTPEQEARFPLVLDKWLRVGLSTEPADRARAEEGVRIAYEAVGLEPPKFMIWLASPFQGSIAAAILSGSGNVGSRVAGPVLAQVREKFDNQLVTEAGEQVEDRVRGWAENQVKGLIMSQVGRQFWDEVLPQILVEAEDQLGDQVDSGIGGQVGDQIGNQVEGAIYGQHEAGWLSVYDFLDFIPGVDMMLGLKQVAESAGWWWPFKGVCILTERPTSILRDDNNQLHSFNGKAIEYRDGWGVYAVHGTRVPPEWIEDKSALTPEIALTWPNIEQRSAAREILCW